jgi:hypothetical protein
MLESLLFLTLGVSCVLLLMLIYHFKQRLTKLEQNNETMFDILNNMVCELSEIKQQNLPISLGPSNYITPNTNKVYVSEDESNLNDSDSDSDSDSGSESETESENVSINTCSLPDLIDNSNFDVSEGDDVKVVNVNIDDTLEDISTLNDDLEDDDEKEDNDEKEVPITDLDVSQVEEIHIDKLNQTNNLEENDNVSQTSMNTTDVYKKMTVASLKSLVIEKGLASDPSKMKKVELLELLNSNM